MYLTRTRADSKYIVYKQNVPNNVWVVCHYTHTHMPHAWTMPTFLIRKLSSSSKVSSYRKCHFQYQSLHHDISSLYNDNCHYYIPCTSVVYSYTHSHTNLLVRSRVWYSGLDEGFGTRLATTIHTHATCMYNTHIFDKFFLKVAWYRKCHTFSIDHYISLTPLYQCKEDAVYYIITF